MAARQQPPPQRPAPARRAGRGRRGLGDGRGAGHPHGRLRLTAPRTAWRCFPWDAAADEGEPYSASYLVGGQRVGRFDLHDAPPVRYLAETREHALGEALGAFRGTDFHPAYLRHAGRPLALVEVTVAASLVARIPDCTEPAVLAELGLRPDQLAHHDRTVTQAVARALHSRPAPGELAGLRWWSALTGAWHTTVVFTDRERPGEVTFATPRPIDPSDPLVGAVLSTLGIRRR